MSKVSQLCVIAVTALVSGCSSLPPEMALDSKVYSVENAGIVLGALVDGGPYGTWLSFRDVDTGKEYGWGPKDYYSAWLPAGTYEMTDLGSRRGVMGPYSKPLRFTVTKGQINYLGEMTYGCPLAAHPAALYGVKNCGVLALATCTVDYPSIGVCVVDRQEQSVRTFVKQYPQFSELPVKPAVMSTR
ncbi:hypothetical protein [Pseudomonas costantinii]|uniref:hypothetical protein n=1 Tax=Pseudomonas costantinii TaxID=168469 RepID=UPI0015A1CAFE|nr:hypothetical protein [Pseudomonas costantinii]NVZ71754.1 hypothetical protein [Pseudomonas costantinii]